MKKLTGWLLVFALLAVGGVPVYAADADVYEWHGYTLVLDRFSTDYDEIGSLTDMLSPAEGELVLAVLRTRDGSAVPEELIEDYSGEFVLTYNGEAPERLMEHVTLPDDSGFGLIFYNAGYRPALEGYALSHQPAAQVAAVSDGASLVWQNAGFTVVSATDDKVSLSDYEWPQTGYLARAELAKTDTAEVSDEVLQTYFSDFVLGNGTHSYRPFAAFLLDGGGISLYFRVEGEDAPALDTLRVNVKPQGALWFSKWVRDASYATQAAFHPAKPQDKTYVLMLEDDSYYRPNERYAAAYPDEAFDELSNELPNIMGGLETVFSSAGFTATDDPDSASVIIGVKAAYPRAGRYGIAGQITAYNCEVTLTAYDARTDAVIAELSYGAYYGSTISVPVGRSSIWKMLPSPNTADDADKAAFTQALADFWK